MSTQIAAPRSSAGHQETVPAHKDQGPSIGEIAVGIFATAITPVLEPFNHGGDLGSKTKSIGAVIANSLSGNDAASIRAIRNAVAANFTDLSPEEITEAAEAAFDAAIHRT